MKFRQLTPAFIRENLDDILAIAADVPGEYWSSENFLRELPDKWNLSFYALDPELIGYAILSRKADGVHLHHLMISPSRRGKGAGRTMLEEALSGRAGR